MEEQKDPELTRSHKHTSKAAICRLTEDEQDWNLKAKVFYDSKT